MGVCVCVCVCVCVRADLTSASKGLQLILATPVESTHHQQRHGKTAFSMDSMSSFKRTHSYIKTRTDIA